MWACTTWISIQLAELKCRWSWWQTTIIVMHQDLESTGGYRFFKGKRFENWKTFDWTNQPLGLMSHPCVIASWRLLCFLKKLWAMQGLMKPSSVAARAHFFQLSAISIVRLMFSPCKAQVKPLRGSRLLTVATLLFLFTNLLVFLLNKVWV